MTDTDVDNRSHLTKILEVVLRIAAGDFSARAPVFGHGDELDGLAAGINMLGEELGEKFSENESLTADLREALRDMERQHQLIMELSTPTISVWDGILVVPLIGVLDQDRARDMRQALLDRVQGSGADVVIVDITGLAELDTAAAKHLIDTFAAVALLGSRCVLTGMSPANAQNIVALGVSFGNVATQSTLREGLRLAFRLTDNRVVKTPQGR
jgi:anti-anti-sigma regulatory factor